MGEGSKLLMLGGALLGALAWVGYLLHERSRLRARLTAQADVALEHIEQLRWWRWWLRNAAEMTALDPTRPHMLRLAIAAQLAPTMQRFEASLHRLAQLQRDDPHRAAAAKAFVIDLQIAREHGKPPWQLWAEAGPGRPEQSPRAIADVYAHALDSWEALLLRGRESIAANCAAAAAEEEKTQ